MLNRIKTHGCKSLRDFEVRLQPLSVLFGPNAAGKSNFLDALQLLSKIVSCRTLKEAFEPPYRGKPLESFSLCRTFRHIIHTWSRPVRSSAVGCSSISSPASACAPPIRSRRYDTSG